MISGKVVLVTGGTGSFGKAFVKEVLANHYPKKMIVLSRDELKQSDMASEIQDERIRFFLGDVRDKDRLYRAFESVDVVIHAAALKQVPSCEYNPLETIKTNIMGAANVIDAAIDRNVGRVIALSTDKAVNPVNLYGATKLCSDKLFLAANSYSGTHSTRFSVVRYGNVVGSRGSVVPVFRSFVGTSEPVRVTHEAMTRFWITLPEAVQFVIDSLDRMQGGETFVPKLPAANILDLVKAITPASSYVVTGIRPGEKIHESLISEDEARDTFDLGNHYVITTKDKYSEPYGKLVMNRTEGKRVNPGFKYTSNTSRRLTVDELRIATSTLT